MLTNNVTFWTAGDQAAVLFPALPRCIAEQLARKASRSSAMASGIRQLTD